MCADLATRFERKVDRSAGPDECHLWTGSTDNYGYGRINVSGTPLLAHRVAWSLVHGPIPPKMYVLHGCDTPACVNAYSVELHLHLGTAKTNTAEMWARNRAVTHSVLTPEDVEQIRMLVSQGVSQTQTAAMFSVSVITVNDIIRGRTWRS